MLYYQPTNSMVEALAKKINIRKELGNLKLNYDQLQTVLLERYYCTDENEPYLTPNHMLYRRALKFCDPETNSDISKMLLPSETLKCFSKRSLKCFYLLPNQLIFFLLQIHALIFYLPTNLIWS